MLVPKSSSFTENTPLERLAEAHIFRLVKRSLLNLLMAKGAESLGQLKSLMRTAANYSAGRSCQANGCS